MDKKNPPKWVNRFFNAVHRSWHYHAACQSIDMQAFFDQEHQSWTMKAAPVFQELYGGEGDGKKVWAGFLFDVGEFSRIPGVWVMEHAVSSYCHECTDHPKLMVKGKFQGRPFFLHIYLEPLADSKTVELIDTIHRQIRPYQEKVKDN